MIEKYFDTINMFRVIYNRSNFVQAFMNAEA